MVLKTEAKGTQPTGQAAQKAAMEAARAAVMKDIYDIAIRAAGRAAREKILAMASKGQIRLKWVRSGDWSQHRSAPSWHHNSVQAP